MKRRIKLYTSIAGEGGRGGVLTPVYKLIIISTYNVFKVRLWESGWKDRYYTDKCKVEDIEGGGGRQRLFQTYVEGLCWVMLYYYQGCPSWTWYFPFHYAPFASDLINCDR